MTEKNFFLNDIFFGCTAEDRMTENRTTENRLTEHRMLQKRPNIK
jgi:hypothetical protein